MEFLVFFKTREKEKREKEREYEERCLSAVSFILGTRERNEREREREKRVLTSKANPGPEIISQTKPK